MEAENVMPKVTARKQWTRKLGLGSLMLGTKLHKSDFETN